MSAAFPNEDMLADRRINRPPLAPGWLREEEAYRVCPHLTPALAARMAARGELTALLETPAGRQVWLRPSAGSWHEVEERAIGARRVGG